MRILTKATSVVASVAVASENGTFNTRRKVDKQYVYIPPTDELALDAPIPPLPRDKLFELKLQPHDRNEPDVWPRKITNLGRLFVGTDPNSFFDVVLDTGSAHLVIPSVNCPSPACERHRQYDMYALTIFCFYVTQIKFYISQSSKIFSNFV